MAADVAASTSGATTTASGSCEVPQPRPDVWRALAVLEPYCAVCDVSYVLGESGRGPDIGTTFVCAPGRLDGAEPAAGAPGDCRDGGRAGRTKEKNVVIQILGLILIGAVIGVLARLIKPGRQRLSMVATVVLGIVGAIIGGLIGSLFNSNTGIFELNFLGFIIAVIAAVLLIGVAEGISGGRSRGAVR